MCSACITSSPAGSNSAVEQSRRSLMFAECAARTSTAPISSHAARSAPVVTCSSTGSIEHHRSRVVDAPAPPGRHRDGRLRQREYRGTRDVEAGRQVAADERRRALIGSVEALRTAQNQASKAIGGAQGDEKQRLIDEVSKVSAELKAKEPELEAAEATLTELLAKTPNIPHESAPDGFTDEDALEARRHGEPARSRRRVGSRPGLTQRAR